MHTDRRRKHLIAFYHENKQKRVLVCRTVVISIRPLHVWQVVFVRSENLRSIACTNVVGTSVHPTIGMVEPKKKRKKEKERKEERRKGEKRLQAKQLQKCGDSNAKDTKQKMCCK